MTILRSVDFPETVRAEDRDALAAAHGQGDVRQHPLGAVRLGEPETSRTSLPLARAGSKRKSGVRRDVVSSSSTSMRSICLSRLCACLAFDAFAPKRSTNARFSAMIFLRAGDAGLFALARGRLLGDERA